MTAPATTVPTRYLTKALKAIKDYSKVGVTFTAEDIRDTIGHGPEFSYDNDMGLAFSIARRLGIIRSAGYTTATRREAHRRVIRTWLPA